MSIPLCVVVSWSAGPGSAVRRRLIRCVDVPCGTVMDEASATRGLPYVEGFSVGRDWQDAGMLAAWSARPRRCVIVLVGRFDHIG